MNYQLTLLGEVESVLSRTGGPAEAWEVARAVRAGDKRPSLSEVEGALKELETAGRVAHFTGCPRLWVWRSR